MDSPSTNMANWLHLSPAASSPFANISCTSRVNKSPSAALVMDMLFNRNYPAPSPSSISHSQCDVVITGNKEVMLVCDASPNVQESNVEDSSANLNRSMSSFESTSLSDCTFFSQSSFILEHPTLFSLEDSSQTFADDVSPVVRSQVEIPLRASAPSETPFLSRLLSSNIQEHICEASPATGPLSRLLSPVKLHSNAAITSATQDENSFDVQHSEDSSNPALVSTPISQLNMLYPLSPLTPLPDSPAEYSIKRKRSTAVLPAAKRPRRLASLLPNATSVLRPVAPINDPPPALTIVVRRLRVNRDALDRPTFSTRTFPARIEISAKFPLFYRRFPASSYFQPANSGTPFDLFSVCDPGGNYNTARSSLDLYTPRFVKGKGMDKVGLCPICVEPPSRGGEGKKLWLAMKVSAFKCYHMQYAHGISAFSGEPFSPPVDFRKINRTAESALEKSEIGQGKCHKCLKWVNVEGVKIGEAKVKEIFWWKHAASCHQGSKITGETDLHEDDHVLQTLIRKKLV